MIMFDSYDVDLCTDGVKIELDLKTAWKIYCLLNSASMYLPDAAAYYMTDWGLGNDIDYVRAIQAKEEAIQCECYAGAIRGILYNAVYPRAKRVKERYRKYEEEARNTYLKEREENHNAD